MERKICSYAVDAVIVFQRVPGPTLAEVNLDELSANDRQTLFRRAGRTLHQIEQFGFSHFDAKASNWIVQSDEILGPRPILIDVDGIRRRRWIALGIERLLKSMRQHPQYTPEDSLNLCRGYAPYSQMVLPEKEDLATDAHR
jgi:hypothetical protein